MASFCTVLFDAPLLTNNAKLMHVNATGIGEYSDSSSATMGPIDFIFVTSYLLNFEFLLDEVPELLSLPRACVVYGAKEGTEDAWRQACTTLDGTCSVDFLCRNPSDPRQSPTNPLEHKIPYGVHHTKMFLVGYATGALRVVIHTANLRFSDIHHKAQGAYIQDFPRKTASTSGDSASTAFEDSLVQYIDTYGYNKKYQWDDPTSSSLSSSSSNHKVPITLAEQLRKYDFSSATAVLIPSIPGYHKIGPKCPVGHLKLRREIEKLGLQQPSQNSPEGNEKDNYKSTAASGPIICQFSSIGSLTKKYLHRLVYSMDISRSRAGSSGEKADINDEDDESIPLENKLQLVYPTSDEICNSLEGYRGGASVPATEKNVSKDFLQPLFRKWASAANFLAALSLPKDDDDDDDDDNNAENPLWKGTNVPHIKTYFQLASNEEKEEGMEWIVLSSHNLSKAAWGDVQNSTAYGEKRLFVRHWELGVLIAPSMLGATRLVPWHKKHGSKKDKKSNAMPAVGDVTVPLPYRHKPLPYSEKDKPWSVDQRYVRLDIFGRRSASDA